MDFHEILGNDMLWINLEIIEFGRLGFHEAKCKRTQLLAGNATVSEV